MQMREFGPGSVLRCMRQQSAALTSIESRWCHEMNNDDFLSPVVGRRQILRRAGALGVSLIAAGGPLSRWANAAPPLDLDLVDELDDARALSVCSLTPSETSGPF